METRRGPATGSAPDAFPKEGAADVSKESTKDKKQAREALAATAIKEVKKPESAIEPSRDTSQALEHMFASKPDSKDEALDKKSEADMSQKSSEIDEAQSPELTAEAHLTNDEARQVLSEYVDARLADVVQEQAEAAEDTAELAAVTADRTLLERMRDEQDTDQEIPPDVLIEQAMQDVIAELGLNDSVATREAEPVDAGEASLTMDNADEPTIPELGNAGDMEPPHDEPPMPSMDAGEPFEPMHPALQSMPEAGPDHEMSSAAIPATTTAIEQANRARERQQDMLKGMLIGGVVGYIIGRRRGRIKTEKAFKPIQEQLQKEADTLRRTVASKEEHIRSLAREKQAAEALYMQPTAERPVHETVNAMPASARHERAATATPVETPKSAEQLRDDAITTILAAEAPAALPTERIITRPQQSQAESLATALSQATKTEALAQRTHSKQVEAIVTPRNVDQMPLPALVKAAETVIIGGKTLKSYYESGQIKEQGMRRILVEHLRTGRTEQALNAELWSSERRRPAGSLERIPSGQAGNTGQADVLNNVDVESPKGAMAPMANSSVEAHDSDSNAPLAIDHARKFVSPMVVTICLIIMAAVLFLVLR